MISIPVDIYYGARRTAEDVGLMGSDQRLENAAKRERLMNLTGSVLRGDRHAEIRLVEIILDDFFDKVPDSALPLPAAPSPAGCKRTISSCYQAAVTAYY